MREIFSFISAVVLSILSVAFLAFIIGLFIKIMNFIVEIWLYEIKRLSGRDYWQNTGSTQCR